MVSQDTANKLWFEWVFILGVSLIAYSIVYTISFQKQLSNSKKIDETVSQHNVINTQVKIVKTSIPVDEEYRQKKSNAIYCPENCMKYASCIISLINCIICSLSALFSLFYYKYWETPLHGTPGMLFYATAIIQAYFTVDACADIIIYFWYKLNHFRFDSFIHHCLAMTIIPWMCVPKPQYAWMMFSVSYMLEFSTIWLNATFFSKWYNKSEAFTIKFKIAFLFSWFLVRMPGTIGICTWAIIYRKQLYNEYPMEKFAGVLVLSIFNLIMQSIWSYLILKKTYRALTNKNTNSDAVDNFDLKRSNSLEITNVTSEA